MSGLIAEDDKDNSKNLSSSTCNQLAPQSQYNLRIMGNLKKEMN